MPADWGDRSASNRGRPPALALLLAAAALAATVLAAFAPTASASGVSARQAIRWLNAQRADNGIPARIADDAEWNEGCRLHMEWWAKNPDASDPHVETPGSPGYTKLGAFAGEHSVLAEGVDWTRSRAYPWKAANPWESAPIHLMQLLAPELSVTGFSPVCMLTLAGYKRKPPAEPKLLAYPGAGTSFAPRSERAEEWPFTPGSFVGLKQGAVTGPYIYVLGWGTGTGRISSATLRGPKGDVPIRTVDDFTTGRQGELGPYLAPGGMLIPVKPLARGTRYTAAVTYAPAPAMVEVTPPPGSEEGVVEYEVKVRDDPSQLSPGESRTQPAPLSLTWSFRTAGRRRHVRRP